MGPTHTETEFAEILLIKQLRTPLLLRNMSPFFLTSWQWNNWFNSAFFVQFYSSDSQPGLKIYISWQKKRWNRNKSNLSFWKVVSSDFWAASPVELKMSMRFLPSSKRGYTFYCFNLHGDIIVCSISQRNFRKIYIVRGM